MGWSRFSELTRVELRQSVDRLVVIPLAATEQHGDHLPVMTDAAIVTAIVEAAADRLRADVDLIVASTLAVGISEHHLPFGGTLSFTAATYIEMLCDLGSALRRQGFGRILFINGHGGNDSAIRVAVERLALAAGGTQSVAGLSYWNLDTADDSASFPRPGHAGRFETSLMLALRPDLVRMDLVGDDRAERPLASHGISGLMDPRLSDWASSDGATDGAAGADAQSGHEAIEMIADALASMIRSHTVFLDEQVGR